MAGFNEEEKKEEKKDKKKKTTRTPRTRKSVVTYEELNESDSTGYTFQFGGLPMTGKTINALALGFINKKNIPILKKEGFKYIVYALENGFIPDIKEIIIVESENAIKKQFSRALERDTLRGEGGIPKVIRVHIPVSSKMIDIMDEKAKLTKESATDIQESQKIYMDAIDDLAGYWDPEYHEWVKGRATENTLVIIDSASRLKLLLDVKAGIVTDLRLAASKDKDGDIDKEVSKKINSEKWIGRNNNWQRCMTQLRGLPGLVVATFMDQEVTEWVLDMNKKKADKGRAKLMNPITRVQAPRTAFNFDMCYTFNRNPLDDTVNVSVDDSQGRYIYRGPNSSKYNTWDLDYDNRYTFLSCIEGMLRIQLYKRLKDTPVDLDEEDKNEE